MLPYTVAKEDDLPENADVRALYSKQGDVWVLGVSGVVPKKQYDDLGAEAKELKKLKDGLGDKTPEEALAALTRVDVLEAQVGKDKDKFQQMLDQRTAEMKQDHEAKEKAFQERFDKQQEGLRTLKIDQAIQAAGGDFGLRSGAGPDLVARGQRVFDLDDDGNIVAKDENGNQRYNAAGEPLAPKDWVEQMSKEAKHLFDESEGGGAGGSGKPSGGAGTGKNPWSKEGWSLTEQSRVFRENPQRAQQLAASQGKIIKAG